jgi:Flp pilus assembly protein TadG
MLRLARRVCRRPLRRRAERGSAIADFALVSMVLVPLFFGVLQIALVWHVKTTLTSAASEGARHGASYDRTTEDGLRRTTAVIHDVFGADFDGSVSGSETPVDGQPVVEVTVRAQVPVLAFWGPSITVEARGHAIKEVLP